MKSNVSNIETCWVIGGSAIYKHFIDNNLCDRIYLTQINCEFECDTYFPLLSHSDQFREVTDPVVSNELQEEKGVQYSYHVYEAIE